MALIGVVVAAAAAGGVAGFVTGRLSTRGADSTGSGAVTAEQVQDANVSLCLEYAAVTQSVPNPAETSLQLLTGLNGVRWALAEYPDASTDIRDAITEVINHYDALFISSTHVQPPANGSRPLPSYDPGTAQQAVDRALDACHLGGPRP